MFLFLPMIFQTWYVKLLFLPMIQIWPNFWSNPMEIFIWLVQTCPALWKGQHTQKSWSSYANEKYLFEGIFLLKSTFVPNSDIFQGKPHDENCRLNISNLFNPLEVSKIFKANWRHLKSKKAQFIQNLKCVVEQEKKLKIYVLRPNGIFTYQRGPARIFVALWCYLHQKFKIERDLVQKYKMPFWFIWHLKRTHKIVNFTGRSNKCFLSFPYKFQVIRTSHGENMPKDSVISKNHPA